MRKSNYDKYPSTKMQGDISTGWESIINQFSLAVEQSGVLAIDMYVGVYEEELLGEIEKVGCDLLIKTSDLFKTETEVLSMTEPFMTDDALFGHVSTLKMIDYFDVDKLNKAKSLVEEHKGRTVVVGCGAALVVSDNACLVYADMACWELQKRNAAGTVKALGVDDCKEPVSTQHKRGYFIDWIICDSHKDKLFQKIAYWLDTHIENQPKMIDSTTFFKGIENTIKTPFRVVPFFAPAPWGGQWMKETFGLDKEVVNYGWCFDCVPEENSLYFEIKGVLFEIPSINLILLKSKELLGAPVVSRFGKEFPIRFDFLDTVGGGALSFQVHPTTQYIREHFGMQYTQDESYYMMHVEDDACVYLGLKNGVDRESMERDLRSAQQGEIEFNAEKYSNKLAAKKHDHFLIPGGTVHCSGPEGVVLEISSTPNLFTFKLWDWKRVGLDGKPRVINVERGIEVIDWERDTDYTRENLVNTCTQIEEGEGWFEEKTGLHINEFIETRRHRFSTKVLHNSCDSVNVLNLVEGEEVVVESVDQSFAPFVIHYAETFIVPASIGAYTVRPHGASEGKECITIKAYVRFKE
jgi:mannose-6-phosphate isomerase class I